MYRFTASPTRDLSINDLRVALFNFICAKQNDKLFIVRMEDIDKAKNIEGKDDEILGFLTIFGLNYDYLYYQSENFKYHLQFASALMNKGKAFACFCNEEKLKEDKSYDGRCINISQEELLNNNLPFTIRIKKPNDTMKFCDTIKGELSFAPDEVDSFVIMKKDKYPTQNFASACDDMLQGVTHIISEEKLILNTPRQEMVRKSLGYEQEIHYSHLSSICNIGDDTNSVKWLLNQGYLPEAIINYLALLGNKNPKEIFTLQEALEWFDLESVSKTSVKFDIDKLRFINREYIKMMLDIELSKIIGYSSTDIGKLAKLYTEEVSTTYEIKEKIDGVFSAKTSQEYSEGLDTLKEIVKKAPYFENFEDFKSYLMRESKLEEKDFFKILRIMLTGSESGPELEDIYRHIKNYLLEIAR